jgi:hypothetical protein
MMVCHAQTTKVYVVGTAHEEKKYIHPGTLENILTRLQPDVFLSELDSTFFTKEFDYDLEKYPDLISTNENISSYSYKQKHPEMALRPFDISGRNEFYRQNDYFTKEKGLFNDLFQMKENDEFSKANEQLFDLAWSIMRFYGDAKTETMEDINSDIREKFSELKYTTYDVFLQICKDEPKLHKWIDFAQLQRDFWIKRNLTMVNNISIVVEEFQGKTLVVFVGSEHKYFLVKELKKNKDIELISTVY